MNETLLARYVFEEKLRQYVRNNHDYLRALRGKFPKSRIPLPGVTRMEAGTPPERSCQALRELLLLYREMEKLNGRAVELRQEGGFQPLPGPRDGQYSWERFAESDAHPRSVEGHVEGLHPSLRQDGGDGLRTEEEQAP